MTCSWDTHSLRTTARHEEKPFTLWRKDWISNFWFLLMQLHKIHSLYCELEKVIKKIRRKKSSLFTSILILFILLSAIILRQANYTDPKPSCQSSLPTLLAPPITSLWTTLPASLCSSDDCKAPHHKHLCSQTQCASMGITWIHPPVWSEGSTIGRRVLMLSEPVPFHSGCLLPSLCPLGSQMAFPLSQRPQSSLRTSWMTLASSTLPLMNPRGHSAVDLPLTMTEPGEAKDAFMQICVPLVPTVCPRWPKRLPPFVGSLTREGIF